MNIDSRKGFTITTMSILNPAYRRDNLAPFYVLDDIFTHEESDRILVYCK